MPRAYNNDLNTLKDDILLHKTSYPTEYNYKNFAANCINLTYTKSSNNPISNDSNNKKHNMCMGQMYFRENNYFLGMSIDFKNYTLTEEEKEFF